MYFLGGSVGISFLLEEVSRELSNVWNAAMRLWNELLN